MITRPETVNDPCTVARACVHTRLACVHTAGPSARRGQVGRAGVGRIRQHEIYACLVEIQALSGGGVVGVRGLGERRGEEGPIVAAVGIVLRGGRYGRGVGAGEGARRGVGCATTRGGELVDAAAAGPWDAVCGEEVPELTVLFGEGVFAPGDAGEVLL